MSSKQKIVYFKNLMKKEKFLFIYKFTLHPQMLKIHSHFYNTPSKCVKKKQNIEAFFQI